MSSQNEKEEIVRETQKSLQKTEREQRLVEGDTNDSKPKHKFTKEDTKDFIRHSTDGEDPPNRDVASLMRGR